LARLLFIGSWIFADDSGVCRANPVYLKSNIFPYDDLPIVEIENFLVECEKQNLVEILENNGEKFLLIKNFGKHQTIQRPSKFRYLPCQFNEGSMSIQRGLNESSMTKVKEKEKVKEKVNNTRKSKKDIPVVCYEIFDLLKEHCKNHNRTYQGNRDKSADIIRLMHTADGLEYDRIKTGFTQYATKYTGAKYDPEVFSARSLREKWNSLYSFIERQNKSATCSEPEIEEY
jgi:hypothetical protein